MRFNRFFTTIGLLALFALMIVPAALAQETPANTITVTGNGSASADPDIATIEIGVELADADIATAYGQVNETIQSIIDALEAQGVSSDDVRTTGLNIFSENMGPAPDGAMQNRFRVSNRVSVTVRDLSNIEAVIDTAVNNGANSIYGLQFGVSNTDALAAEARVAALDNARERAQQIADHLGVTLGEVLGVSELNGGINPMVREAGFGGGGMGAVIEPGSFSVPVSVEVTFRFNR